jgi:formylglycine-generating enzyme required for sulfatase activity
MSRNPLWSLASPLNWSLALPTAFLALTALAVGCGGGSTVAKDAGSSDASPLPDASDEVDLDQDGYPQRADCDDTNPDVYPGVARPCLSVCDDGWDLCLASGQWRGCDARTDCDCLNPGDQREVTCGNCGTGTSTCGIDQKWTFPEDCQMEGVCTPGTVEYGDCLYCGTRERLCTGDCVYTAWDESECTGVCEPGTEEIDTSDGCANAGERQNRQCNTECTWETTSPCTNDCAFPPRTGTTDFKDEVCIPGGPFVMGSDPGEGAADEEPEHIVTLSPYFIDVYPVTVARYRECIDAGGCLAPQSSISNYYSTVEFEAWAISYLSFDEANTYCAWDGGRRLLTEAEWEKAARGPVPREAEMPWGDSYPTCEHVYAYDECPTIDVLSVDAFPLGASYYGVQLLLGHQLEWVSDWYDDSYYSISPTVNPKGPVAGTLKVLRGGWPATLIGAHNLLSRRGYGNYSIDNYGLRCARDGF